MKPWLAKLLSSLPVLVLVSDQFASVYRVRDESPVCVRDLAKGDIVLVLRVQDFVPGDVVGLTDPGAGRFGRVLFRRLTAQEGAWQPKAHSVGGYIPVPRGHLFVSNDVVNDDIPDSYTWGSVPKALIVGRAAAVMYPFSRMRLIPIRPPPIVTKTRTVDI